MELDIELQAISSGYDRGTCWVRPRPGAVPGDAPIVVVVDIAGVGGCEAGEIVPINSVDDEAGGAVAAVFREQTG